MQKIIKLGAIFYLCFISFSLKAQDEKGITSEKNNILKINLPALAFKNISVQYERVIGKRSSIAVNVRMIPFSDLSFQSKLKSIFDYDQLKLGSFGITPEFRYYVGKKRVLRGFYLGPFISYTTYKVNLPIRYNNNSKMAIFDGNLKTFTGGLQFGSQFKIGKNMFLDWWILGPNYGSASGTLNFAGTLTPSEQSDLETELEMQKRDAPFNAIKSYTVTSSGGNIVVKGPWGGLRGLGFSLGFGF